VLLGCWVPASVQLPLAKEARYLHPITSRSDRAVPQQYSTVVLFLPCSPVVAGARHGVAGEAWCTGVLPTLQGLSSLDTDIQLSTVKR